MQYDSSDSIFSAVGSLRFLVGCRILKTLDVCKEVFGEQTKIVLARELTKKFEEFIRGTIKSVSEEMANREILGEFIVLVEPLQKKLSADDSED